MDSFKFVEQLKRNMAEQANSKVTFIGVAGGSASGKSSIAEIISHYFQGTRSVSVLNVDLFYKNQSPELIQRFNGKINWDDPFMIDHEQLVDCMEQLSEWKPVHIKKYDYTISLHIDEDIVVMPADIVIVEGIFAFHWPEVRKMEKLRIFVDCGGEYRLMRRIIRDVKERGRTVESVIEQYARFVKPSYDKFIHPQIKFANLVLPWENIGEDTNLTAVEILINYISVLSELKSSRPATPAEKQ